MEPAVEDPATEIDNFKKLLESAFEDDNAELLMDEVFVYMHFREIVPHFESASALAYFRSPQARSPSSTARNVIDSGRAWV